MTISEIDTPERWEKGYNKSKNRLKALEGKNVILIPIEKSYDRIVADVLYKDKRGRMIFLGGRVKRNRWD